MKLVKTEDKINTAPINIYLVYPDEDAINKNNLLPELESRISIKNKNVFRLNISTEFIDSIYYNEYGVAKDIIIDDNSDIDRIASEINMFLVGYIIFTDYTRNDSFMSVFLESNAGNLNFGKTIPENALNSADLYNIITNLRTLKSYGFYIDSTTMLKCEERYKSYNEEKLLFDQFCAMIKLNHGFDIDGCRFDYIPQEDIFECVDDEDACFRFNNVEEIKENIYLPSIKFSALYNYPLKSGYVDVASKELRVFKDVMEIYKDIYSDKHSSLYTGKGFFMKYGDVYECELYNPNSIPKIRFKFYNDFIDMEEKTNGEN